ncbi:hypothetical protein [Paenibacillus sp. DCT19]|uniref:hypothetical protein n=1 Tax=Paenibacillus sp. DCT19 TaxID=2211212 RepID=UPI0020C35853|nr:hypothetical protein [Paenibacillus sp. DCT19]
MMKSGDTNEQLFNAAIRTFGGQARQVQLILRQWLREWGPDAKITDLLAGRK